ncbi:UDP-xylose and UDP-N-acetylglucosamine transporter isoform X2 [Hydra vulgaris]|uniref:UDP-xylose and UDP-N-acetylglucosamine transporter isoform X2 n=1 Tax=Hydra vulgaris TaxID=6087 RepID=A0ABM4DJ58_HYDVU
MKLTVYSATFLTFVACATNVIFLEHLVKFSPGCGELVTFAQFLFIASYGFITVAKFGTESPKVPIREYLFAVVLFYGSSISGNLAFECHISMPIQMIFKSGSVMASMALGVLLLKRSYSLTKYVSVAMITIGIGMCLLFSTKDQKNESEPEVNFFTWLWGVFLLTCSLFMGARLGVCQEEIALKYGKYPEESSFYLHALALPGFLFFSKKIYSQASIFTTSEYFELPIVQTGIPVIWLYLAVNVATQFVCIKSVYQLSTEMSSLSVTVVLTLRKFLSLLISIYYFQNPFTIYHWIGSALVFTGTLLFTGVLQSVLSFSKDSLKKTN